MVSKYSVSVEVSGFVCIFIPDWNENRSVDAVETRIEQQSNGLLHFIFRIPQPPK